MIAVDTAVEAEVDATVTTNNLQAGEVACQYIADRLRVKAMWSSLTALQSPR